MIVLKPKNVQILVQLSVSLQQRFGVHTLYISLNEYSWSRNYYLAVVVILYCP